MTNWGFWPFLTNFFYWCLFDNFWSLGFSRWGLWIHARPSVRASVRHTISGDLRIRFWWFFAQSYILMSLKNVPSWFLAKKSGFWAFSSKPHIRISHNLLNSSKQLLSIINGSVVSGKILVLGVLAHFWSKIHCLWWQFEVFDHFWPFWAYIFKTAHQILMIFVQMLEI